MAKAQPIRGLRADLPYAQAAAVSLRIRAAELFAQADGLGDTAAIEQVHDIRVASRRLRSVLELYGPCFPADEAKSALRDLKRLAGTLGVRRDLDVQVESLDRFAAGLPTSDHPGLLRFIRSIRAEQDAANARLAKALRRIASRDLAGRLEALAAAAEEQADPDVPLADAVAGVLARRLEQLVAVAPAAQRADATIELHDLRIAAKRLRYTLELTGRACFGPYARTAARRARDLQDVIGEIHDCDEALPRVQREVADLVQAGSVALRERAGEAPDIDPELAGDLPQAGEHRGLMTLQTYLTARRALLHEQFVTLWYDLQQEGFVPRLEFALTERPATASGLSHDRNESLTPPT